VILCYGKFIFTHRTVPFAGISRQSDWRIAEHKRIGERPLLQYVGPDNDKISIKGILYPQVTLGAASLEYLRVVANSGESHVLIDQLGWVYGLWAVKSVSEEQTHFLNGFAQKIEFTLSLIRDGSDDALSFGTQKLVEFIP